MFGIAIGVAFVGLMLAIAEMTGHKEMASFWPVSLMGLAIAAFAEAGLRMAIKQVLRDSK